jgi:phage terminase small subunit
MAGVKGRSGRPRLSAEEHRLRGTYRADRHGPLSDEPAIDQAPAIDQPPKVVPPRDLSAGERSYWSYFAPLLASARALTPADRDTLADYCRACVAVNDRNRRLTRELRKRTLDRPTVKMLDAQLRSWIGEKTRLATELGLTALSRTRIKWTGHHQRPQSTATPEKPQSKLAQLQEQAASLRRPIGVK